MVRFQDVSLRYGAGPEILDRVSLDLAPGSFHFVIGASGAGKSSLLKMMYLANRPTSGRISLFGRDVSSLSRHDAALLRRRIGVVFQDFRLLDHLSTLDNVALPLKVSGQRSDEIRKDVVELLTWVGLADHLDAKPATLSGGQQQRVAIARAVVSRPSLLLADEPTGNVDNRIAERLLYLFEELNKRGTTIVVATHNEALISRFNYPVIRLVRGEVRLEHAETLIRTSDMPGRAAADYGTRDTSLPVEGNPESAG
ncbi:cell division ATP-binding protein FtsE [Denitrobaculum tricleocarpae]|uniref:Cell division ATP-binding protein FtsE n=1 Tax=Denitrobaculum tricleocarpae TaxID=2591009 RepID=A0A545U1P4_9PROT|nr:cell division ATP-binding protein FtsE [Denitrobaculum tricleocarpae]TQV83400.1 cell division ATP-binding protein FtsE [Denitrobaculum tricleocarpae]